MKIYAKKWITQRVTALILIPLIFWFVNQSISFYSMNYQQIIFFFSSIFNATLFYIMMISMIIHAKLGCETITEDYISSKSCKNIIKLFINLINYTFIIIVTLSILKITFIS